MLNLVIRSYVLILEKNVVKLLKFFAIILIHCICICYCINCHLLYFKKDKKEKQSSVRKAPNKSAGKFFKNSPKQRKEVKNTDMSWFENDDIFGFALED